MFAMGVTAHQILDYPLPEKPKNSLDPVEVRHYNNRVSVFNKTVAESTLKGRLLQGLLNEDLTKRIDIDTALILVNALEAEAIAFEIAAEKEEKIEQEEQAQS